MPKTFILSKYKVLTTGVEGGHKYLTTRIFNHGVEFDLPIFFKDKQTEDLFTEFPTIALKGIFKEENNPLTISLLEAEQVEIPTGNNWLTFFTDYFLSNGIDTLTISEHSNGYSISTNLEHYSIWAEISKDKLTTNKIEFGRFLPLEKPEYLRKSLSWIKGVFVNDKDNFIQFIQTSWFGEEGEKYSINYTENNLNLVTDFLSVPINIGWNEYEFRLGKDGFYKASGKAKFKNFTFENTFTLLDIGEQDIPYPTDKLDQWIRTKWGDCFINNFRRKVNEINIEPIKKTTANSAFLKDGR